MANVTTLTPETWSGNDIQSATYTSKFLAVFGVEANTFEIQSELAERSQGFGAFVPPQPLPREIQILIRVNTMSIANVDQLKKWFNPENDEAYLIVSDSAAASWRMECKSLGIVPWADAQGVEQYYVARLLAAKGVWEDNTETHTARTVTSSPDSPVINNTGTTKVRPRIVITPNTVKSDANNYRYRRQVIWASQTDNPYTDPDCPDGWPVELTGGGWDTATLVTALKMQADGDDVRVFLDGAEVNRWFGLGAGAINTAATRLWININARPMVRVTCAAMASGSSPATAGQITLTNIEGTSQLPYTGAMIVGTECIEWGSKDDTVATLYNITRGARNTTAAAHAADAEGFWVEHRIDVLYGYTAAANPPASADRMPYISLNAADSDYNKLKWPFAAAPKDEQSAQWQRLFVPRTSKAGDMQHSIVSAAAYFVDIGPNGGPNKLANQLYVDIPSGIKNATGCVVYDADIISPGLALDVTSLTKEGREIISDQVLQDEQATGISPYGGTAPGTELLRLTLAGRYGSVTGFHRTSYSSQVLNNVVTAEKGQQFSLDDETQIDALCVAVLKSAGSDRDLKLNIYQDDGNPDGVPTGGTLITEVSIPASSISTSMGYVTAKLSSPLLLPAGKYWLCAYYSGGTTGTITWGYATAGYSKGKAGSESASVWTTDYTRDYGFLLLTLDRDHDRQQSESPTDVTQAALTGDAVIRIDNIALLLNDATFAAGVPHIPSILWAAEQACYMIDATLANVTTVQVLAFKIICNTGVSVTLDCEARTCIDTSSLGGGPSRNVLYGVTSNDPDNFFHFNPGNNLLAWTEAGVVNLTLDYYYRIPKL